MIENVSWLEAYFWLCAEGALEANMCKSYEACDLTLRDLGYSRYTIPATKPETTVRDFAKTHVNSRYVLATSDHMVAVIDGYYIDTWDSGNEVPLYFYKKGK